MDDWLRGNAADLVHDSGAAEKRLKILIVEDDPDDVFLLQRLLSRSEYQDAELISAKSADDAVSHLETRKFDLALVDFWLGRETSVDLLRHIAIDHELPAIVLSSLETEDIRKVGLRAGALGFLPKSGISASNLAQSVRQVLQGKYRNGQHTSLAKFNEDLAAMSAIGPWLVSLLERIQRIDQIIALHQIEATASESTQTSHSQTLPRISSELGFLRRELLMRLDRMDEFDEHVSAAKQSFRPFELLKQVNEEFQLDADARQISVILGVMGADRDREIFGDPVLFRDLLSSLYLNGFEALENNGRLQINVEINDRYVYLVFTDGRERISVAEVQVLLRRFHPSGNIPDMLLTPQGSNLQLASQLATTLGGYIDLDKESDEGSTLVVSIPHDKKPSS